MILDLSRTNDKQKLFFEARERYVAYGGARGGGKSWAVRMKALMLCMSYPGIRVLIIRRSLPELEENLLNPMRQIVGNEAKYRDKSKKMSFQNGSVIVFGYCDNEGDVLRYQGQEYDCIFLDEGTQLTEYQYQTFKGCLRGVNDFPKRLYITCNPGGVGHAWVKRLFIDRVYQGEEKAEDHRFIQAGVYDNAVLMESDPGYVERLKSLPYEMREAWLYGKWDVFVGQFFTMWDRSVHVIDPFEIPAHWKRYVTMDYGTDMLAAYVIAVDESGNAYVTREVYEGRDLGEGHNGLIISEACEAVKEMCEGIKPYVYLAPDDMWNSRQETGKSVADIFAENGVYLTKSSRDRTAGWAAMKELLRVIPDESGRNSARLRIFGTCANLIRTLPLLAYDQKKEGDAAINPHEVTHASDAIRYFAVYWWSGTEPVKEATKQKLIDKLQPPKKRRRI